MLDLNETIRDLGLGEDALKHIFKKCRSFLRQNDILFSVYCCQHILHSSNIFLAYNRKHTL